MREEGSRQKEGVLPHIYPREDPAKRARPDQALVLSHKKLRTGAQIHTTHALVIMHTRSRTTRRARCLIAEPAGGD